MNIIDMAEKQAPIVAAGGNVSWAPGDWARVERLVGAALAKLRPSFDASDLVLVGFVPPYDVPEHAPDVHMEVYLTAASGDSVAFSVDVSKAAPDVDDIFADWTLDDGRIAAETSDTHGHVVEFTHFDELWRFVCRLGEELGSTGVRLRFGA